MAKKRTPAASIAPTLPALSGPPTDAGSTAGSLPACIKFIKDPEGNRRQREFLIRLCIQLAAAQPSPVPAASTRSTEPK